MTNPDAVTAASHVIITSRITEQAFRRFAVFDTLIRQRRLLAPVAFSSAFLIFSVICVLMRTRAEQALLLAAVMLGIAVIFPAVYIGSFLHSVSRKAADLRLGKNGRHAYTIEMTDAPDGITIVNAIHSQGTLRLSWKRLLHAFRAKGCIYLYVSDQQAFLLPDDCANISADELWNYLGQHMGDDRLTVIARRSLSTHHK